MSRLSSPARSIRRGDRFDSGGRRWAAEGSADDLGGSVGLVIRARPTGYDLLARSSAIPEWVQIDADTAAVVAVKPRLPA